MHHTFVPGKEATFYEMTGSMTPEQQTATAAGWDAAGFHCHSTLPTPDKHCIHCVWECKADTSPEEFQAFIDGPKGPGPGILVNECHKVRRCRLTSA